LPVTASASAAPPRWDERRGAFDGGVNPPSQGQATGYTVGGVGWYRKTFRLSAAAAAAAAAAATVTRVRFDGVYQDSDYWLNGAWLGSHPVRPAIAALILTCASLTTT